jgi:SAM-dependent methyltransferase
MSEKVVYVGKDLEAMSFAVNYHRWIFEEIAEFLGDNVVEVGAGIGSFSEMLVAKNPRSLSLVEPSGMYKQLAERFDGPRNGTRVETFNAIFAEVASEIEKKYKPDSIIYINVLEHVEDDLGELKLMHGSLKEGGRCLIFVPALKFLYGDFDRTLGHYRRYGKSELEAKCRDAGFKILSSRYFDFAGVLPWFVKYRILRSVELGGGAVELYDNLVVPIFKRIESLVRVPVGKNILLIAEKE